MSKGGRGGKSPANCSHSSTFSPVLERSGREALPPSAPEPRGLSESGIHVRSLTLFPLGVGVFASPPLLS